MRRIAALLSVSLLLGACTSQVDPSNPFDPGTPANEQLPGRLEGRIASEVLTDLSGLEVRLSSQGRQVATAATDAGGAYFFEGVVPGLYELSTTVQGFLPMLVPSIAVTAGDTVDVGAYELVELREPDELFPVTGSARLDRARSHAGIAVRVADTVHATTTDAAGDYGLLLAPGEYLLRFSANGYASEERTVQVAESADNPVEPVTLQAQPSSIAGVACAEIRDDLKAGNPDGLGSCAGLGRPLSPAAREDGTAAALAVLEGPVTDTVAVDADGAFSFTGLVPGSYVVRVTWPGYRSATAQVLNLSGGQDVGLPEPVVLDIARGSIRGVVALPDAANAAGTTVQLEGWGVSAATDADGAFRLEDLMVSALAGPYQLVAKRTGYVDLRFPTQLTVEGGAETAAPPVELERQAGDVMIREGYYVNRCTVTLVLNAPESTQFRVAEDPSFEGVAFEPLVAPDPANPDDYPYDLADCLQGVETDGRRNLYVQFADAEGKPSAPLSADLHLDRVPPEQLGASLLGAGLQPHAGGQAYFTNAATGIVPIGLTAVDPAPSPTETGSGLDLVWLSDTPDFANPVVVHFGPSAAVTLPEPGVDGLKRFYLRFFDRAGNAADLTAADGTLQPLEIVLDRDAPADLSLLVESLADVPPPDPTYTSTRDVLLRLTATDAYPDLLQMSVSNDPGFRGAVWEPFTPERPWFLTPGDGAKTVYVRFRDAAGTVATLPGVTLNLLTAAPGSPAATVTTPMPSPGYLATPDLALGLSAVDAYQMEIAGDVQSPTGWVAYGTSWSGRLAGAESAGHGDFKTVQVRFRNRAGGVSEAAPIRLILDGTAPVAGQPSFPAGAYTSSAAVLLNLPASGADRMRLSGDLLTVDGSPANVDALVPAAPQVEVGLSGADGLKTVSITYEDLAGNASAAVGASITLDTTPPTATLSLYGPADGATSGDRTRSRDVTAAVAATDDGAGVTQMRLADTEAALSAAAWLPYQARTTWTLPQGDGLQTVYVQVRDAVGNASPASPAVSGDIVLDETPPTPPGPAVAAEWVSAPETALTLAQPSTDATSAPVRYEWITPSARDWTAVTFPATLPLVQNDTTQVRVRAVDGAGNVSAEAGLAVEHDSLAPRTPVILTPREYVPATTTSVTLSGSESDRGFDTYETCIEEVAAGDACPGSCTGWSAQIDGFALSLTDGVRTCLFARARDFAGNVSGEAVQAIVSDLSRPVAPDVQPALGGSALTVRADSVELFVHAQAHDLPLGGPGQDNVGIAWLELDAGSGFAPVCPESTSGVAWNPCDPANRCQDTRLRCRSDGSVSGLEVPLVAGQTNVVGVRAVDLAGNVGDAIMVHVDTERSFRVTSEPQPATRPRLFGTTLAWSQTVATSVPQYEARLIDLGPDRRPQPTDPACSYPTATVPNPAVGAAGLVYAYAADSWSDFELRLVRWGDDHRPCTGDEPPPVVLATGSRPFLSIAVSGETVAWTQRPASGWDYPVFVREPGADGLAGTADDVTLQLGVTTSEPSTLQLGTEGLLVKVDQRYTNTADWVLVTPGATGYASADTYAISRIAAALSPEGDLLFTAGQSGGYDLAMRARGPDGLWGTADDVVSTVGYPSGYYVYGFDLAFDGRRGVAVPSNQYEALPIRVWHFGADGVFGGTGSDDVVQDVMPTSMSRTSPDLYLGMLVYEMYDNLFAMDLTTLRWEAVPPQAAFQPAVDGIGGLFYREDWDLRLRQPNGDVRLSPWHFGRPNYAATGSQLVVTDGGYGSAMVHVFQAGPDGIWFTADDLELLDQQTTYGNYTHLPYAADGKALIMKQIASSWTMTPVVIEPGPNGLVDGTFVSVQGDLSTTNQPRTAGISMDHAVWNDAASGGVGFRDAGADRVFGTADDPVSAVLAKYPDQPTQTYWSYEVALSGNRLVFSDHGDSLTVVDAGLDRRFNTSDDRPESVPLPGACVGCPFTIQGDLVVYIIPDDTGIDQLFAYDLRSRATVQLTHHLSLKAELTMTRAGTVYWMDTLFPDRSIFLFRF